MLRAHLTRTRLGFLLAVVTGVLLGAVVGQPGSGRAAATTKPTLKTPPTIPGPAEVGLTLKATRGTWTGNPTSYHFQWLRCDTTGAACAAIPGATGRSYTPTTTDIGRTLRVRVTARNSSGSTTATSAATGVVPASGCPEGSGAIPISRLTPPARLEHRQGVDQAGCDPVDAVDPASPHDHRVRSLAPCRARASSQPRCRTTSSRWGRARLAPPAPLCSLRPDAAGSPRAGSSGFWPCSSVHGSRANRSPAA